MSYPNPASKLTKIFWIVVATIVSIWMTLCCIKAFQHGEYSDVIKGVLFGISIWTIPLHYLHRRTNQDGRAPTNTRHPLSAIDIVALFGLCFVPGAGGLIMIIAGFKMFQPGSMIVSLSCLALGGLGLKLCPLIIKMYREKERIT